MRKSLWILALVGLLLWAAPALAQELTFDAIYATVTIPDSYTVITPDTLEANSQFLLNKGVNAQEARAAWAAEGILCQAWNKAGDACLQITALQDVDAETYFDMDQQTVATRAAYRKEHLSGESYQILGIDYSSAEWKKTAQYGRFLMLKYIQRTGGEIVHRGYARKTIRNGYTIMLDYRVYGRNLKGADNTALNKIIGTWHFTQVLPLPASKAAKILVNALPPEETNSSTFTYSGTAEKDMVITAVVTRMSSTDSFILSDTASSTGKFSMKVTLPQKGVYLMTVTVEKDGVETESLVYPPITYDTSMLPVNFTSTLPEEITGDKVVIAGTTLKGTEVQFLIGETAKKKLRVGSNKKFTYTLDTSAEGSYNVTVVFSKKGLETKRFSLTGRRVFSDDEIKAKAREGAVKPAYKTLTDKLEGYTGRTMVYTAYVTKIENVNGEWLVYMAMRQMKNGEYREPIVVSTLEEPILTVGTQAKFYGVCQGAYESLSEEGSVSYPLFELLFWDR